MKIQLPELRSDLPLDDGAKLFGRARDLAGVWLHAQSVEETEMVVVRSLPAS